MGKNSNPGSLESPLKNIDKALKIAAAGDVVLVAEGTYQLARLEARTGKLDEARANFERALHLQREHGDLKAQGKDAIDFYTDKRVIISRW